MKKPTKNDLLLLGLIIVAVLTSGIGIGRCTKKTTIIQEPINISRFTRIVDSVKLARKKDSVVISYMNFIVDSLTIQLKNKNQLINETNKIKKFTSSTRLSWADSLFKSEGLR